MPLTAEGTAHLLRRAFEGAPPVECLYIGLARAPIRADASNLAEVELSEFGGYGRLGFARGEGDFVVEGATARMVSQPCWPGLRERPAYWFMSDAPEHGAGAVLWSGAVRLPEMLIGSDVTLALDLALHADERMSHLMLLDLFERDQAFPEVWWGLGREWKRKAPSPKKSAGKGRRRKRTR